MEAHRVDEPSPWVVRFASAIAHRGAVLDVAAGRGRHARYLEALGHRVTAIDRDAGALSTCGATERIVCDLEADGVPWPVAGRRFAAVVVTNYLHRPTFARLVDALDDGGLLIYETFAVGNERFGKPSNPAFLLAEGELLERCRGLSIVAFEDGLAMLDGAVPRPASIQRICAASARDATRPARRHVLSQAALPAMGKSARIASLS